MKAEDKIKFERICEALRRAYGKSKWEAWKQLKNLQLGPDERVDVLMDRIKALLNISSGEKAVPDELVSMSILDEIPPEISRQIRLRHAEQKLLSDMTDIATSAKALLLNRNINLHGLGAVVEIAPVKQKDSTKIKVSCFK